MTQTGPSTPETKAIVSLNALRSGLQMSAIVIPNIETESEWLDFSDQMVVSLEPVGALEEWLAARVAELAWRLRRVVRAEQQGVVDEHRRFEHLPKLPLAILPEETDLKQITRYEAHLYRQFYKALHELEALKDRRDGKAAPLARVEVHAGL